MAATEGIFSLRLVIADFYMEKPVPGLDPIYSEFRGKEIKKVPIIRVFGSNAQGQKTCMHIHGVFPYFYVPFDQKDFESVNKAIYQMAMNLDKAINISLSQGSSEAQHVYKVQLVKGIPFYGYHRAEHHFLKIYMFNPRFIRRAANLLQNGAIMNKNFHPHESHVPYILQFMIDYNLYGMSFIHIPMEVVKYRLSDSSEEIPIKNVKDSQILDPNVVKKLSCSSVEIDIGSNFILNRFQLISKTNTNHTNPGIESIWNDEKMRREKLTHDLEDDEEKLKAIPALEIPTTQERPNIYPTESEIFYRTALVSKLAALELENTQLSDQTLNSTQQGNLTSITLSNTSNLANNQPQKKTFNLSKILQNSVYPEECTQEQEENIINASVVENHLSNKNLFNQSVEMNINAKESSVKVTDDESIFLDDTVIDENLVLSLTQSQEHNHVPLDATLRDEDLQLLDLLQQLEEDNNDENKIDLDSSLAPISQNNENYILSPDALNKNSLASDNALNKSVAEDIDEDIADNDDDNIHDFSIALENLDDLILKFTQSQVQPPEGIDDVSCDNLNQIDGSDDLLKTPTKSTKRRQTMNVSSPQRTPQQTKPRRLSQTSPSRSPRTPKSLHKYRPLPLIIKNRSTEKKILNDSSTTPIKSLEEGFNMSSNILRKNLALHELRRKSISLDSNNPNTPDKIFIKSNVKRRNSKNPRDLDKTHVTCNLTPRRTNEKLLKVYNVENNDKESSVETNLNSNANIINSTKGSNYLPDCNKKDVILTPNEFNQQDNEEEIIESDEETTLLLRKTPNLKRLRRSFLSSAAKKQKIMKSSCGNINSLKFENKGNNNESIDRKTNTEHKLVYVKSKKDFCETNDINLGNAIHFLKIPETKEDNCGNLSKGNKVSANSVSEDISDFYKYRNNEGTHDLSKNHTKCLKTDININLEKIVEQKVLRNGKTVAKTNKKGNIANTKNIEEYNRNESKETEKRESIGDQCNSSDSNRDSVNKKFCYLASEQESEKHSVNFTKKLQVKLKRIRNPKERIHSNGSEIKLNLQTEVNDSDTTAAPINQNNDKKIENKLNAEKEKEKVLPCIKRNDLNTDNLLKSLLKLNCSIRTDKINSDLPINSPSTSKSSSKHLPSESPVLDPSSEEEISETPPDIYNNAIFCNSPVLFTQNSSPNILSPNILSKVSSTHESDVISVSSSSNTTNNEVKKNSSPPSNSCLIITPLDMPPTREEVLKGCIKLNLPQYEFQQPFYSNPEDITKRKEIGFTILQIPGNTLNDLEEFESLFGADLEGLNKWRRKQLLNLGGPEMLNKYRNSQRIREYFANQKKVSLCPVSQAPTKHEAKLWLKARELLRNKDDPFDTKSENSKGSIDEDSPIKIRRQKVTMMMNNNPNEENCESDNDSSLDCSTRSITLTPVTPGTPLLTKNHIQNKSFTPLTTKIEKIRIERSKPLGRPNRRRVLKRISLNQKMKNALKIEDDEHNLQSSQECKIPIKADETIIPNSQASESSSVSSQTALAEMERSSFMNQIQSFDVTLGTNSTTLNNTFGFKVALENLQQAKADIEFNYLTIITLEVFVTTREDLYPDPQIDEIRCLFYAIENSIPNDHIDEDKKLPRSSCGYIMVHDSRDIVEKEGNIHGLDQDIDVNIVETEVEALETLLGLCSRWDPDIYAGYEIEMSSWGFVIERAKYLCLNISPLLSRVPSQKIRTDFVDEDREQFTDLDVEMKLCGRILLDVWRLMRSEIALTSYTFENVMYHIMHKRCPWHSYRTLTEWFVSPCSRWIVLEYYLERVRGTLSLLDQLDLIGRTSEMAKLIGIQFYEVLSRGSQFRVESMMLRIAKPKNLVPLSPSVQQRAHMRAPEYLPLILEPQSRFYADPLIVLDFQSLYPSMIIGYNYCFSTCLGRVEHLGQSTPFEFGASQLRVSPSMIRKLVERDLVTISPCGVVFVKSSVREGILPRMLTEILDTRQMVKQSMKLHKTNSALQRILHSRQLGLKLMANTTYGYTAANFSGRMPAVEVGDTVVAKGRETLERAIKMVEANEKWNVKVVYGDTDSLFVLVPGRSREQAFLIGEEIAEAVTKQNPQPVKLKLEKVYQPCILQTKKRYVGYMYETPDQKEPIYEAKGIETVRRDGCPIVAKMLEKVLRILFETADVSQVKHYVCRQFTKLLSGRANLQDLIFAKEFRGLNGYKASACVPALELTRKWLQTDPRRIPRRGERVPFIITSGPPGVPLIRLIRHPHEVLGDEGLKINAIYYITKAIIPPLNRCLLLLGADVHEWFANLPRKILMTPALSAANEVIAICPTNKSKKSTISQFFSTTNCITDCGRHTKQGLCEECCAKPLRSMSILQMKISKIEKAYLQTQRICEACCGRIGDISCGSLDCPVLYVLEAKRRDLQQIGHFRNVLEEKF